MARERRRGVEAGIVLFPELLEIELVKLDRFTSENGSGAYEGFFRDGAWHLSGGSGEPHDELAVVLGSTDMLEKFQGNVTGIEVGKYQHIRGLVSLGVGVFDFSGGGIEGDVGLQLATDFHVKVVIADHFSGEHGGRSHFLGRLGVAAAFGRVAEHRHPGGAAEKMTGKFSRLHGDRGELLHVGIRDHAAVCHEQDAITAEVLEVGGNHDHGTEYPGNVWERFDHVDGGAENTRWHGIVAGDHAVGVAVLNHHGAKVVRTGHQLAGVCDLPPLVASHLLQAVAEELEIVRD